MAKRYPFNYAAPGARVGFQGQNITIKGGINLGMSDDDTDGIVIQGEIVIDEDGGQ
jgi:hypothetical protein